MVEFGRRSYLEKKFSIVKYDMNFIYKCLQKDVLDFQEFNKEVIRKQRPIQEELLRLIQEAVSEVTKDFEVFL